MDDKDIKIYLRSFFRCEEERMGGQPTTPASHLKELCYKGGDAKYGLDYAGLGSSEFISQDKGAEGRTPCRCDHTTLDDPPGHPCTYRYLDESKKGAPQLAGSHPPEMPNWPLEH